VAEGDQDGMDAVLEADAMVDQVQPPARPLPLGPHLRGREPDRRHQVTTAELGKHRGVDLVGLAGQGRQSLGPLSIRDLHLPPQQFQLVVDEPGAGHRLDHRPDRLVVPGRPLHQGAEPVPVGEHGSDLDRGSRLVDQVDVEALSAEIQSSVQHW
jgi:hypothetical protein